MFRQALMASSAAVILTTSGCYYTVKVDPNDDTALVYVNGVPQGRGQADVKVDAQYGWPSSFGVKVEPKDGKPYSVQVERKLDMPRAVIGTAVAAGVGVAYLISDLMASRTPTASLVLIAYAPLNWLSSYHYDPYYDLSKLRDAQMKGAYEQYRAELPPVRFGDRLAPLPAGR